MLLKHLTCSFIIQRKINKSNKFNKTFDDMRIRFWEEGCFYSSTGLRIQIYLLRAIVPSVSLKSFETRHCFLNYNKEEYCYEVPLTKRKSSLPEENNLWSIKGISSESIFCRSWDEEIPGVQMFLLFGVSLQHIITPLKSLQRSCCCFTSSSLHPPLLLLLPQVK